VRRVAPPRNRNNEDQSVAFDPIRGTRRFSRLHAWRWWSVLGEPHLVRVLPFCTHRDPASARRRAVAGGASSLYSTCRDSASRATTEIVASASAAGTAPSARPLCTISQVPAQGARRYRRVGDDGSPSLLVLDTDRVVARRFDERGRSWETHISGPTRQSRD